jgi:hypothetical protein
LRTTYEGPEYPGFIAVGNDAVEFGLSRRVDAEPREDWTYRVVKIQSPNGMEVLLEEQAVPV